MYQARLSKHGARRLGYPQLAGKLIEYNAISTGGEVIDTVFYNGEKIGGCLSFVGKEAGVELITRPSLTQANS